MKHLKAKLMAAVAMLLVATVMLTSASFAWFTISTAPEVTDLTTQVVVNENLEIALQKKAATVTAIPDAAAIGDSYDSDDPYADTAYQWGNLVDLTSTRTSDNAVTDYNALTKTLRPATLNLTANGTIETSNTQDPALSLAANTFYYPVYGNDGRITTLQALKEGNYSGTECTAQYGFGNLVVDETPAVGEEDTDEEGKIYGYYVDYWVRTNVSGTLALSDSAKRSTAGEQGNGSYFQSSDASSTTDTDQLKALETLADNIQIAFKDITPDVTGAEKATGANIVVANAGTPASASEGKAYKTTFTCDEIVTLKANQAKLIRVYIYLEGKDVTNAAASIDNFTNGGSLNIQFKLVDSTSKAVIVDKSMDSVS